MKCCIAKFHLIFFSFFIFLHVSAYPQVASANVQSNKAYDALYQKIFGKSAPEETIINAKVRLYIDLKRVAWVTIRTNSFSTRMEVPRNDLLRSLRSFIKVESLTELIKSSKKTTYFNAKSLEKLGFEWEFIPEEQKLFITTPMAIRKVSILRFSKKIEDASDVLNAYTISGFSNISLARRATSFPALQQSIFSEKINLDNHVSIGPLLIDNTMSTGTYSYWRHESLTGSYFFSPKKWLLSIGFLEQTPIAGIQINSLYYRQLTNQRPQKKVLHIQLKEPGLLVIKINGNVKARQDLFPGKYILKDFPLTNGPNLLDIYITSAKNTKDILFRSQFFEYHSPRLLSPLDHEFNHQIGYYDDINIQSFSHRVQNKRLYKLKHRIGLFSIGKILSNPTWDFSFNYHDNQTWSEQKLSAGTEWGVLALNIKLNKLANHPWGFSTGWGYSNNNIAIKNIQGFRIELSFNSAHYSHQFYPNPYAVIKDNPFNSWSISSDMLLLKPFPYTISVLMNQSSNQSYRYDISLGSSFMINAYARLSSAAKVSLQSNNTSDIQWVASLEYQIPNPPLAGNVAYNSQSNLLTLNTGANVGFIGNVPLQISLLSQGQSLSFTQEGDFFNNSFGYTISPNGDNLSFQSSLDHSRGFMTYSLSRYSGASDLKNNLSTNFILNTAIMFAGKKVAVGRPVVNDTFLIASAHPKLAASGVPVTIGEESQMDTLGSAGIGYLTPFQANNLAIKLKKVPLGVEIKKNNIEFIPKYGRGYHIDIGTTADLIVVGRLVDKDGNSQALKYGKITWKDGQKNIFTNRSGKFQTTLNPGINYTLYLVEFKDQPLRFHIPKKSSGIFNLRTLYMDIETKKSTKKIITTANITVETPTIATKIPPDKKTPLTSKASERLSQLNIEVLNGIGIPGITQHVAKKLSKHGFSIARTLDAGHFNYPRSMLVSWKGKTAWLNHLQTQLNISSNNIKIANKPHAIIDASLVVGKDVKKLLDHLEKTAKLNNKKILD